MKFLSQISDEQNMAHEKNVKEHYWKYISKCIIKHKDALPIEKYAYRVR